MPLRTEDEAALEDRRLRHLHGVVDPSDPAHRVALRFLRQSHSEQAVDTRAKALRRAFGWLRERGVAPLDAARADIEDYFASVAGLATGTQRHLLVHLRGFYEEALDADDPVITRNPTRRIRIARQDRAKPPSYTEDECELILTSIQRTVGDEVQRLAALRDYLMALIALTFGLRLNELRLLAWGDLRPTPFGRTLFSVGKFGKSREDICSPAVLRAAEEHREALEHFVGRPMAPTDAMFPPLHRRAGRLKTARRLPPMSRSGFGAAIKRRNIEALVTATAIDPRELPRGSFSSHRARVSAITIASQHGADLSKLQQLGNHAKLSTTLSYVRLGRGGPSAAMSNPLWDFDADSAPEG